MANDALNKYAAGETVSDEQEKIQSKHSRPRIRYFSSIQFRLLIILTFMSVMLVFLSGFLLIGRGKAALEKSVLERNSQIALGIEQQLCLVLAEARSIAQLTAKMPELQDMERFRLSTVMHTMINEHAMIESAVVIDKSGKEISSSEFRLKYRDRSSDPLFRRAMESRATAVSPVTFSDVTRLPVFDVYVPVLKSWLDPEHPMGVLAVKINLQSLWPIVENVRVGKTGRVYVTDHTGRIIAHSTVEERRRIAVQESFLGREPVRRALSGKRGIGVFLSRADGSQESAGESPFSFLNYVYGIRPAEEKVICSYVPLRILEGAVIFEESLQETFAGVKEMQDQSVILLLAGIFLAVVISIIVSRSATRPIEELVTGTQRISKGDLKHRIGLRRKDEIGNLAESFNAMSSALEKKIQDLYALQQLSTKISSVLKEDELLRLVISLFSDLAKSEKTSLMLLEEDGKTLSIRANRNIDPRTALRMKLGFGKGIAGIAAQTGRTMLVENIADDDRYIPFPEGTVPEKNECLLSIPLSVQGKIIGVVNLSRSSGLPHFRSDDIVLYNTLANQVAAAVYNAMLYEMAITDGLTRIYIQRYFLQRLEEEIERSYRYRRPLSLLMIDVDHFKRINDTYGHQQGDITLKTVADLLRSSIRDTDVLARYGGEEFTIIIPEEEMDSAALFAERLCKTVASYDFPGLEKDSSQLTVSIGVSSIQGTDSETFISREELLRQADRAMYLAKEQGRNRVCLYSR